MTDTLPETRETAETRETPGPPGAVQRRTQAPHPEDSETRVGVGVPSPPATVHDSGGEVAEPEEVTAVPRTVVVRRVVRDTRRYLAGLIEAPDVLRTRIASPVEIRRYARHGRHTPPAGWLRRVLVAYADVVAAPLRAFAHGISWWFERPARALVTVVTAVAVWLTPPGQTAATVAAWCMRTAADWIVI